MGFYVSTETITSVGFGDIVPVASLPKLLCALEMFLGLFFNVFLVSGALEKFAKPPSKSSKDIRLTALMAEAMQNDKKYLVRWLGLRRKWVRCRDSDTVRGCRTRCRKLHILVSLTTQFFAMLLLVVYRQHLEDTPGHRTPLLILFFVFCLEVVLGCTRAYICIIYVDMKYFCFAVFISAYIQHCYSSRLLFDGVSPCYF